METQISSVWSEADWETFCSDYWERRPARLPTPAWAEFCSLDELFAIVLAARGSDRLVSDRFWVGRTPEPESADDFAQVSLDLLGPQSSDRDLAGFFKRMHGRCFGINLHRLEKWRPELQSRLREPIKRLHNVLNVGPVTRWDTDSFFGTYRMTPFGIHKDRASVFSYCLLGERTYLTWPPDYTWPNGDLHTPDPACLDRHRQTAERFRIRAGEMFYWPSNRWHVVCSDGYPSAVIQLSAYFGSSSP